jgi:3-mercaptopyruvate sulfurtransferase SseA
VARRLQKAGWKHARAIIGGWKAWQEAGRPVEPRRWVTADASGGSAQPERAT